MNRFSIAAGLVEKDIKKPQHRSAVFLLVH